MTNEQATALLQMLSSTLMMTGLVCRFLEAHPLMDRTELADYVEEQARRWPGDAPYAVVIQTFLEMLRQRGEPTMRPLLH
jgi:hypothetical protein